MEFWKMNGAGNDFIILDNRAARRPAAALSELARSLCERRLSLGADGLIAVEPAENGGDFRMRFFNADGSVGEMCGNGARCICRYGYENGLCGETQAVETTAGLVRGRRLSKTEYRVLMNRPSVYRPALAAVLAGVDREIDTGKADGLNAELCAAGLLDAGRHADSVSVSCAYVELGSPGVPHAVVPYRGLAEAAEDRLRVLGHAIRHSETFPKGANVNFYEILEGNTVLIKTYERGVEDFTYACGSGSTACAFALREQGAVGEGSVRLTQRGGTLTVEFAGNDLYLSGSASLVATGELAEEALPAVREEKE